MELNDAAKIPLPRQVADTRLSGPEQAAEIEGYLPGYDHAMDLAIRTRGKDAALESVINRELKATDPEITVSKIKSMDERLGGLIETRRYSTVVLGVFAFVALLVAALGI